MQGRNAKRGRQKLVDYLLHTKRDYAIAVVEAKAEYPSPTQGLQQAIDYAVLLDLPFAYSTNGTGIVEHDLLTGQERDAMKFTRAHLRGAQALGQGNYDPDLEAAQAALIDETFDELHVRMQQQLVTATSNRLGDALTPKPMTSLRDVERPVPFRPAEGDHRKLDWFEHSK